MTFLIVTAIITAVIMLIFFIKSEKFFKTFIKSALLGIFSFSLVYFFGSRFGIEIPINYFTMTTTALLGAPGVGLLIISKYLL